MNKLKKAIYITIGFITLGLGAIGLILPILPTTPLLLIASFCFVRGSARLNQWFRQTKMYKKHLAQFIEKREMSLRKKIVILVLADSMILIPCVLVDNLAMRIVLGMVMVVKLYYFVFKIKTVPSKKRN